MLFPCIFLAFTIAIVNILATWTFEHFTTVWKWKWKGKMCKFHEKWHQKTIKRKKNRAKETLTIGRCSSKNHIVQNDMLILRHTQMVALSKCISLYAQFLMDSVSTFLQFYATANLYTKCTLAWLNHTGCYSHRHKLAICSERCNAHQTFGYFANRFLIILTWKYCVHLHNSKILRLFIEPGGIGSLNPYLM